MPRAKFQFVYSAAQRGEDPKTEALERVRGVLEHIDRKALRDQISQHDGYEVVVSDLGVMQDKVGFMVAIDMAEPPRRADTVKSIFDELKRIERRVQIYAHYLISAAFNDENWAATHGVRVESDMVSTGGFLVGSVRQRSWLFPVGVFIGAAAMYYALNFESMNELVLMQLQG